MHLTYVFPSSVFLVTRKKQNLMLFSKKTYPVFSYILAPVCKREFICLKFNMLAHSVWKCVELCNDSKKLGSEAKMTGALSSWWVVCWQACSVVESGTWSVWFYFNVDLNCGPKEGADSGPLPKCCVGISFELRSLPVLNCALQNSCSAATFNKRFGDCCL